VIPGIVAGIAVEGPPVDPIALSIYNKLAEWWTCDSLSGGGLVGQHAASPLSNLNGAITAAGKINDGVDLESSSSQGFYNDSAPPSGTYGASDSTSCCLWFKPESLSAGQSIFNIQNRTSTNGNQRRLNMYVNTDGTLVGMAGNGTTLYTATTGNAVSVGTFSFMQAEVVPGGSLRARINDGTWASAVGPNASVTSSLSVRIGLNRRTGSVVNELFADGIIDEVALFDDNLTDLEWDYLYNDGNGMNYATLKAAAGL
jgi:hypothetical protein